MTLLNDEDITMLEIHWHLLFDKKILKGVSIGVHAHSAGDAEVCNKVLNEWVEKEEDMDVSEHNLPLAH